MESGNNFHSRFFLFLILLLTINFLVPCRTEADFLVQIASTKKKSEADKIVQQFVGKDISVQYSGPDSNGWFRISSGPYSSMKEVSEAKKKLAPFGYTKPLVVPADFSNKSTPQKPAMNTAADTPKAEHGKKYKLRWQPNPDPNLTGYKIFYDTKPGPPYTPSPADFADEGPPPIFVDKQKTEFTLNGLTPGEKYYFSITALYKEKDSSKESNLPKKDLAPEDSKPRILQPNHSPSEAKKPEESSSKNSSSNTASTPKTEKGKKYKLKWKPNPEPNLTGYKIYYDTKPGPPYAPAPVDLADEGPPPIIVDKKKSEFTLNGLTPGKKYYFSITAFSEDSLKESNFSKEGVASTGKGAGSTAGVSAAEDKEKKPGLPEKKAPGRSEQFSKTKIDTQKSDIPKAADISKKIIPTTSDTKSPTKQTIQKPLKESAKISSALKKIKTQKPEPQKENNIAKQEKATVSPKKTATKILPPSEGLNIKDSEKLTKESIPKPKAPEVSKIDSTNFTESSEKSRTDTLPSKSDKATEAADSTLPQEKKSLAKLSSPENIKPESEDNKLTEKINGKAKILPALQAPQSIADQNNLEERKELIKAAEKVDQDENMANSEKEIDNQEQSLIKSAPMARAKKIQSERAAVKKQAEQKILLPPFDENLPLVPYSMANITPSEITESTKISAGDTISIYVASQPYLSREYDIDPSGNIYLGSIGKIYTEGLTVSQLQTKLLSRLGEAYSVKKTPEIQLINTQSFIKIQGGIRYSGWYKVPKQTKISYLISLAGGLLGKIDEGDIKIRRTSGNEKLEIGEIPLNMEIEVHSNDIIIIPTPDSLGIKLDAGDLIYINIPTQRSDRGESLTLDFERNQAEVDRYGYVTIPGFGNIYVNGLTTEELSQTVTDSLPKYLSMSSSATVNIIEKRQYIQILGHVQKPGWYNLPETANVQAALNAADGAVDGAIMSDIMVQREIDDLVRSIKVNLFQYTISGDSRLLSPLQEEDTIFVPISSAFGNIKRSLTPWSPPESKLEKDTSQKIRILGAVREPGYYEPKKNMDLLEALVMAKGETQGTDLTNVQIIRDRKMIKVNMQKLLENPDQMPPIQNGDILRFNFKEGAGLIKTATKDKVRIIGAVGKSGGYDAKEGMTILDLIARANGDTAGADLSNVQIIRGEELLDFNLKQLMKTPDKLPLVRSGDIVRVNYLRSEYAREQSGDKKVKIIGAVVRPAAYEYRDGWTILDIIAEANGETGGADMSDVLLIRDDKLTRYNFNQLLKTPEKIPKVKPGDLIKIGFVRGVDHREKAGKEKIRIIGGVNRPAGYEYRKGITLLDLIAEANGESRESDLSDIKIIRKNNIIKYNLKNFLEGDQNEAQELPQLKPGDLVHVAFLEWENAKSADSYYVMGNGISGNGDYQLDEQMTVLQAIALAGGLTEFADRENIMILRTVNGKQRNIPYNYNMAVQGKNPEINFRLKPNDIILVQE